MLVRSFLTALRQRIRLVVVCEGTMRLVAILGLSLFAFVLFDWGTASGLIPLAVTLPVFLRVVALGLWTGLAAVLVWQRLLRPLIVPLSDQVLCQLAERRLPGLDGRLFTAFDGIPLAGVEQANLERTLNFQAVKTLSPASHLRPQAFWGGGTIALLLVCLGLFPTYSGIGIGRFFSPLSGAAWPQRVHLEGTCDQVVPVDQPLKLQAWRKVGSETARLTLEWEGEKGLSGSRRLDSTLGPWSETLSLPEDDYRITLSAGERAQPLVFAARVVARPDLSAISATIRPPAYILRYAPETQVQKLSTLASSGVLPGSTLDFTCSLTMDPRCVRRRVELLWNTPNASATAIALLLTGQEAKGEMCILRSGVLALQLAAEYESGAIDAKPEKRFTVEVRPDQAPTVQLDGARRGEAILATALLRLDLVASDDQALVALELLSRAMASDAKETPAMSLVKEFLSVKEGEAGQRQVRRQYDLEVKSFGQTGQILELQARAKDANDVTGPGIGESEILRLRLVSEEELRAELDTLIHESHERVGQARDTLGKGLAGQEPLPATARTAETAARRASDLMTDLTRRWRTNRLDAAKGALLEQGLKELDVEARSKLSQTAAAPKDAAELGKKADESLAKVEQILDRFLRSDDLLRDLERLNKRTKDLADQTRAALFDLAQKGKSDSEEAKKKLKDLSERQTQLANQVREWEGKLLGAKNKTLDKAKALAQAEPPSSDLDEARRRLDDPERSLQASQAQDKALKTMEKLLDLLKGQDGDKALAKRFGELAARQESLAARAKEGENPKALEKEQDKLNQDTEEATKELPKDEAHQKAQDAAKAARSSQEKAENALGKGKSAEGASEGQDAASMLRQVQRELDPPEEDKGKQKDPDKKKSQADVLKLLEELRNLQARLVAQAVKHHETMQAVRVAEKRDPEDAELSLSEKKSIGELSTKEEEISLRLKEEGMKELEKMVIALRALKRVDKALDNAVAHLQTPALGSRGVRLTKIVLKEMEELIQVVKDMPPQESEGKSGQNPPGGGGNTPPFPPRAEIALVMREQEILAHKTASLTTSDVAIEQAELVTLVDALGRNVRPGTRPAILISRAQRAMLSAQEELLQNRRSQALVRNEQDTAVLALRQLLAELKAQGGGGDDQQPNDNKGQDKQKPQPPSSGNGGGSPGGASSPGQGGNGTAAQAVQEDKAGGRFMHLAPKDRERVLEAETDKIPAGAKQRFLSYLELLERE